MVYLLKFWATSANETVGKVLFFSREYSKNWFTFWEKNSIILFNIILMGGSFMARYKPVSYDQTLMISVILN